MPSLRLARMAAAARMRGDDRVDMVSGPDGHRCVHRGRPTARRQLTPMSKVFLVAGARPNFMKIAPLYKRLCAVPDIEAQIVHTGQHYDEAMSDVFFRQLGPSPAAHLAHRRLGAARRPDRPRAGAVRVRPDGASARGCRRGRRRQLHAGLRPGHGQAAVRGRIQAAAGARRGGTAERRPVDA